MAPTRPKLPAQLEPMTVSDSLEAALASGALIWGEQKTKRAFYGVRLERSQLKSVDLSGIDISGVVLCDIVMDGGEAANGQWPEAEVNRAEFANVRLTGLHLAGAKLTDVIFESCRIDLANFRSSQLKRVRFVDCKLSGTDFFDASMDEVEFETCDLSDVSFERARLRKVDLRQSDLTSLKSLAGLGGAIITDLQALELAVPLARTLGMKVVSTDDELSR